ncbi:RNA polymerase sigma-70 factor (ECF subfamily) [Thermosporothrix hazakensis]|uniref:RNA polymerase sigma-70 factor (ECF subfamily) n=1 Tax=Thermosporothrix hazakensis TaxID=644383 RepID=A0A326UE26_THEHA|nr:sigma-70 family RNA polymerase sigma factor [Thermosporothrix hazakensis]PZW36852.1 RNA polymerase sigma-70 factor (ECF subfamily) [Thermosporothrix hazakensis]GCE47500.1 RNA polymerase sigma factor [Thermosporothrix hazakensis]
MSKNNLSDEELVSRCQRELPDSTQSFEMLVQRYKPRIYLLVYRLVRNVEEAEDVTQEVFIKLYYHLHSLDQQGAFTGWMYRVAMNAALDALKRCKRDPHPETEGESVNALDQRAASIPEPDEQVISAELRSCIQHVLSQLKREQARALILRDVEGLEYKEVARLLGTSLSAAKMRVHRARLAFQRLFMQEPCGRIYFELYVEQEQEKRNSYEL